MLGVVYNKFTLSFIRKVIILPLFGIEIIPFYQKSLYYMLLLLGKTDQFSNLLVIFEQNLKFHRKYGLNFWSIYLRQ